MRPILDVSTLLVVPCKFTVPEIDLQLDWKNGTSDMPMKKLLKHKQEKLKVLIDAVEAQNKPQTDTEADDGDPDVDDDSGNETDIDLY